MLNITALRARMKGLFLFCIYRHLANAVTEMKQSGIEVRLAKNARSEFTRYRAFLALLKAQRA